MALDKAQIIVQHILGALRQPRRLTPISQRYPHKPLFVGLSGAQGSGKTTITNKLVKTLSEAPHGLKVLSFSMDDVYLAFDAQTEKSRQHPTNKLIEFRGLPGTHDIQLGTRTFEQICQANEAIAVKDHALEPTTVTIPSYDKAMHAGRGDQLPESAWPRANAPFDVVLFEGWCLGFKSIDASKLEKVYSQATEDSVPTSTRGGSATEPSPSTNAKYMTQHSLESLQYVNSQLALYEQQWYPFLDTFVQMAPPQLSTVFEWRQEQEDDLWAKKTTGMTPDQVRVFVERFMPCYEVYLDRLLTENVFGDGQARGDHLKLDLDRNRDAVKATLL